ncbi:hypothetical protein VOLCADRAFT_88320 [Volvox carteri f. nagariensis]|uniref:Golgin-84 n=1 Tax=Volvox carteri f. nagariensis TaxID=3068 RepID=D8TNW0_VOLCA|nr:uncharacterized protein VOLCADRAFT_88320 [Volvox carteri f. nagariensis]EFJ50911.1 hypothetical protein VOLCADRAFT_88320 [Volvox carteri f. nagariensis]|eukprot:XP_002947923.1 hypothetical protein VOLCADRAFT_88320 [Volvox carteri f. nagariensis]
MASWITAQLKAAEGLLEAVDKTVSRTVGTLGLAEGDAEQLTPEYGFSSTSVNLAQASAGTGIYQQSYSSMPAGSLAYQTYSSNLVSSNGPGAATSYYTGVTASPPWETRPTAPAYAVSGPSSGRTLTAASESTPGGGGFTVKTDAPIPFGGPPGPVAPSTASSSAPGPSSPGFTWSGLQAKLPGSEVDPSSSLSKSTGLIAPAATASAAPAAAAAPLVSGPSAAASPLNSALNVAPAVPSGPGASGAMAASPPQPSSSLPAATEVPTTRGSSPRQEAPGEQGSHPPVGSLQKGGASAGPSPAPALASSSAPGLAFEDPSSETQAGSSEAGPGSAKSDTPQAPGSPVASAVTGPNPAGQPQQQQQQQQQHQTAGGGGSGASPAPAPVVALASATTAAASTLASATTTAVTHSMSFFNLVFDDPDAAAAADAGGGGGFAAAAASGGPAAAPAQQQIQSLSRTCDQLRKRLEASRVENEQLEDMLARAEVRAQQEAALVSSLREELAGLQQARATAESSLAAQLAVAKSSLSEVSDKYEASQRTVLVLEGQLAALEESSRRLLEQHSDREGGMVEALRSELAAAEARLAAETKAHQASRTAAAVREMDLEQQIAGSTAALAGLTRSLEEANRKCRGLEEEVVAATRGRNELAAQVAALQLQLTDAGIDVQLGAEHPGGGGGGGTPARGGGGGAAAAAMAAELEVLRSELAQHQRAAALARQAAEASQAQAAALAQEVEALRLSAEQRKDTAQLEAQLREVSDMLYLKQTQMERLAAEKAAQQLKTERELESVRQELAKLSRQAVQQGGIGRGLGHGGGGVDGSSPHDVIPMDALGEPYQRLVRHNRVGRAVKAAANFLDSTASTTSFVLRQYPLARVAVFLYAVLIHLYVYFLIARMQRMATHYEAAAVAPTVTKSLSAELCYHSLRCSSGVRI